MNTPKSALVQLKRVSKTYGAGETLNPILKKVDLSIYPGEITVITGNSGSGKSTLLNLIGGLEQADSGEILYQNRNIAAFRAKELALYRRNALGFVFQFYNLIGDMTVRENVRLAWDLAKSTCDVDELLRSVSIYQLAKSYPAQISGGEQQRVAIARALAKGTGFLLCDEPTGALDYKTGKAVMLLLEHLVRHQGITLLMVTHETTLCQAADQRVSIREGHLSVERNLSPKGIYDLNW